MKTRIAVTILFAGIGIVLIQGQSREAEILNHKESKFTNDNCKKTKTCDLKKVEYVAEDYKVIIGGDYNYGTRFFARYETNKAKNLEKYAFVQFIKGCQFSSALVGGEVVVNQDISYRRDRHPDRFVAYHFKDWVIDTDNPDPIYGAVPGKSRFFDYLWNTIPGSFSKDSQKIYGLEKPKLPQLYIVDHPGPAYYMNNRAHNISIQFKMCIYKTKDVPKKIDPANINFAEPLSCYEWGSSFVYNHSTGQFESFPEIVPACR